MAANQINLGLGSGEAHFSELRCGLQPAMAAAAPQPAPTGNGPEVLPVVIANLTRRAEAGEKKYGTRLRAHNGRSALRDAREEAEDQLQYLTQLEMEWPALVAQVRHDTLEEAYQLAEVYLHLVSEPGQAKDELDRLAAYSNATVRRIMEGLRGLQGKPPGGPEPVQGPRRLRPRKVRKPHRWAKCSQVGELDRWECLDCPLLRHAVRGPRDGHLHVFTLDGVELARGVPNVVRVPLCPPAPTLVVSPRRGR